MMVPDGGQGDASASSSGGSSGIGTVSPCSTMPVTPNASPQAQKLLCYIYSLYGNHVLSGQQETSWQNPAGDITWYATNGLKYPAILGGDFLYRDNGGSCTAVSSTTTRAIAYWNAGGVPMIRYHMGMPGAGLTCMQDCYIGTNCAEGTPGAATLDNAVTAGSVENTSLNGRLDYVAVQLKAMQAANVPVILALFHEAQPNGWFWWSKGTGAQYAALWKYAFKYLTTTKGLNNIIWLMPYSGLSGVSAPTAPFFPGKTMVDLSGPDYQHDPATFNAVKAVVGSTMPIPLHESNGVSPATWFPTSPFVLWNVWAGYETMAASTVKAGMTDSHTITRDMVPNLK
jgi:Glycosyl hydrolase family 26